MSKASKLGIALLVGGTLATVGLFGAEKVFSKRQEKESSLLSCLNEKVRSTMEHAAEIPGLKAAEFQTIKPEIQHHWQTLLQKGVLEIEGTDKEIRPSFVALQALVEHVLSNSLGKEVSSLTGIILTPMPATPLCTKGEISKELVAPSLEADPNRLFTVKARTVIVRDFLHLGGHLYVAYPKEGLALRTEEQQAVYQQELKRFSGRLIDTPLPCDVVPHSHIGALYLYTDQKGKQHAFAIEMTQAKDPQAKGKFGLWLGSMDNAAVRNRVQSILSFLEENGSEISALENFQIKP